MPHSVKAIRRLRTTVFVIVVSGLSLASICASRREPPRIRIGEIRPIMNFSTVRVQGVLESEARVLRDGALLYRLADETGSLPVFLNHVPGKPLPEAGDPVVATGRISMGAGSRASMRVHDAGRIEVMENITPTLVCGQVAEVWSPPPDSRAPYRMILDRPEGRIEIVHWFAPAHQVVAGAQVEAEGVLGFYKGRMQLKVRAPGDVRLYPEG